MSTKQEHLTYIKQHGLFKIDCSVAIFNDEETEFIQEYGHWLKALQDGILQPVSLMQEYFVQVCNGERQPLGMEEKTWFKYLCRKKIEQKWGERMHQDHSYQEEGFYTRNMKKQMNKMMYSEMGKNHHR